MGNQDSGHAAKWADKWSLEDVVEAISFAQVKTKRLLRLLFSCVCKGWLGFAVLF